MSSDYRLSLCALFLYGMAFGMGIGGLIAGATIPAYLALAGGLVGGGYYLFGLIDQIEGKTVEEDHAG